MSNPFRKMELPVLAAGLIVATGLLGFVDLMGVARDAAPHAFDSRILLAFRVAGHPNDPIGPIWLEGAVRDITSLGSTIVLALVTLAVIGHLLLMRQRANALFVAVAVVGGQALASLLKHSIDRPRPELVSHLVAVHTPSFPSGHSMMSAVVYLTLGMVAARFLRGRLAKAHVMGLAVMATLAVGVSRLYLGVHWPSDVFGGWCAGFAWAMLCWLVAHRLRGGKAGA
jgi:undecaprenyl-diphosphatase